MMVGFAAMEGLRIMQGIPFNFYTRKFIRVKGEA
jgi:hypothetical protein